MKEINGNMSTIEIYTIVLKDMYRWALRCGHYATRDAIQRYANFLGIGTIVPE